MLAVRILEVTTIVAYVAVNALTAKAMTAHQMRRCFILGQCTVGKICANIFYAPAWMLKGIKHVVNTTIA